MSSSDELDALPLAAAAANACSCDWVTCLPPFSSRSSGLLLTLLTDTLLFRDGAAADTVDECCWVSTSEVDGTFVRPPRLDACENSNPKAPVPDALGGAADDDDEADEAAAEADGSEIVLADTTIG